MAHRGYITTHAQMRLSININFVFPVLVLVLMMMLLLMPIAYCSMRCYIERSPFDLGSAGRAKVHGTPPRHSHSIAVTLSGSFGTGPYVLKVLLYAARFGATAHISSMCARDIRETVIV